jgi:nucleotide-binding universal stress UspA family protein
MSWKPILVGVDATLEAARAAAFAARLAETAKTSCTLMHVVREPRTPPKVGAMPATPGEQSVQAHGRETVLHALWGSVPPRLLEQVQVRSGRAPVVLRQAATELNAELIVIGGKHHTTLGQWVGRSTAMHLARTADVPVVVTRSASLPRRVLAAVDTSAAARVTLEAAERWTDTCGAELRVLSVVELLPVTTEMPFGYTDPAVYSGYYESARTAVERDVWPLVKRDAHKQLRFGRTLDTIVDEAETWAADLLVVGTHGRGWVERTLLGSVAEGLLHALPTSLLVVPAHAVLAAQATSKR